MAPKTTYGFQFKFVFSALNLVENTKNLKIPDIIRIYLGSKVFKIMEMS